MSKRRLAEGIVLSLVMALFLACTPQTAPAPAPQAPAPAQETAVAAAPTKPAWQLEWEKAIQAAKSEASLVVYTTSGFSGPPLRRSFKVAYGINAEFVSGPTAAIGERVLTERRAGIYLVDLAMQGSTNAINMFAPAGILQPLDEILILPDVINPQNWQGGELRWVDSAHKTTLGFFCFVDGQVLLNQSLVKPEELKSWRDLLNPKWKKQILIGDVTLSAGPALVGVQMMAKIMGWDYMRELDKQEPVMVPDIRLQVEWVARGKYPIALGTRPEVVYDFWKLGVPIALVTPVEGVWTNAGSGTLNLLKNAPHPNAAKVFVN